MMYGHELRNKAEALLSTLGESETDPLSPAEIRQLQRELRLREIELELRNQEVFQLETEFNSLKSSLSGDREREENRELIARLLLQLDHPGDLHEQLSVLTDSLRTWSGCEAVGIRLQVGEDYPYFETRGLTPEFVRLESRLCSTGPDGSILREAGGNPVLECMCGKVLRGDVDLAMPFFTPQGSFWCNNTTELAVTAPRHALPSKARNRCIGAGYESMALVPLRADQRTFGLLQFSDRRPDVFTPPLIAGFESVAGSLAHALLRRQADEALRRSEERFRTVADFTCNWEYWIAPDGSLSYVSPSCQRITGYRAEEFKANPKLLTDILHPADREVVLRHMEEAYGPAPAPTVGDLEFRIRTRGGEERWLAHTCLPVYDSQGVFLGRRASNSDITERKWLEASFQQAQKLESIGHLAGGIAHEFNNLLAVINGYSHLLLRRLPAEDPMRISLSQILKAGERAAELTGQLLAYSRKQVLQPRRLDLNQCLQAMSLTLRRLVGNDIDLQVVCHANCGWILADQHQIEQVVMNLVLNARDAMPRGGRLLIETASVDLDEAYTQAHPGARPGPHVMLSVSDEGVGMDEETKRRIFEPFFTTKPVGEGTGLGLSMVHGSVTQSGGSIDVESEQGQGTNMRVYLPASEGAPEVAERPEAIPASDATHTVLVVEDQNEVREFIVIALQSFGYRVLQAGSASEALATVKNEPNDVDLVLTDVVMPNGNGKELAARLTELRPGIRILFMSGYTRNAMASNGILDEDEDFIEKPFSLVELAAKVREMLRRT